MQAAADGCGTYVATLADPKDKQGKRRNERWPPESSFFFNEIPD